MHWREYAERSLPEHLDARGDLAPPWVKFPEYERNTLGWRMGSGESWLGMWGVFLERLGRAPSDRVAYLRRHAPAPFTWAESVYSVIHPERSGEFGAANEVDDDDDDDDTLRLARVRELEAQGLIASDIAYSTWSRQNASYLPWEHADTPENAARNYTRELWFWSRRVQERKACGEWEMPELPQAWETCSAPLRDGAVTDLVASDGLLGLARMMAAGRVAPPWELGLGPDGFTDSFEDDMGYVDAFRLWGMSAFDDRPQLERFVPGSNVPVAWRAWMHEHFRIE